MVHFHWLYATGPAELYDLLRAKGRGPSVENCRLDVNKFSQPCLVLEYGKTYHHIKDHRVFVIVGVENFRRDRDQFGPCIATVSPDQGVVTERPSWATVRRGNHYVGMH